MSRDSIISDFVIAPPLMPMQLTSLQARAYLVALVDDLRAFKDPLLEQLIKKYSDLARGDPQVSVNIVTMTKDELLHLVPDATRLTSRRFARITLLPDDVLFNSINEFRRVQARIDYDQVRLACSAATSGPLKPPKLHHPKFMMGLTEKFKLDPTFFPKSRGVIFNQTLRELAFQKGRVTSLGVDTFISHENPGKYLWDVPLGDMDQTHGVIGLYLFAEYLPEFGEALTLAQRRNPYFVEDMGNMIAEQDHWVHVGWRPKQQFREYEPYLDENKVMSCIQYIVK